MIVKQIVFQNNEPQAEDADILLFCRGQISKDSIENITYALTAGECGAVVPRTVPYAAEAYCDPVTLDINSATFDAFAVSAKAYNAIGGLDAALGEAAATDLVWRLRAAGYAVRYLPKATVTLAQQQQQSYGDTLTQSILMRCKHGSLGDVWRGKLLALKALAHPAAYQVRRGSVLKVLFGVAGKCISRFFARSTAKRFAEFHGAGLWFSRGQYCAQPPDGQPRVSLIIRTCKRPETLRKTLESLRHQTYKNFEIVIIEDDKALCGAMVAKEFSDLDVTYKAMGKNVGRAVAANEGFSIAKGDYLNLLDDDDYLMPDHIELAVAAAQKEQVDMVFLQGIALETQVVSKQPYQFMIHNKRLMNFPHVDVFTMARQCITPDNGVLFKKELLKQTGGMRTELGAHEDWSLWLRLITKGTWTVVPYASCCFVVPADEAAEHARLERYAAFDDALLQDDSLMYCVSAKELKQFYDNTIQDFMYLKQRKELDAYIDVQYRHITKKGKM